MAWAFCLLNLTIVLLAARLRYAGAALAHACPVAMRPATWWLWIGTSAALAAVAAAAGRRALRRRGARRAYGELLAVFPPFFAFEWGMLPPHRWRFIDWLVMVALVALIGWFLWREQRNVRRWGVTQRGFVPAVRLLALPTAAMVAVPIVAACFLGTDIRAGRAVVGVLTYPLYALVQLFVLEVFLVRRLWHVTRSFTSTSLVAAATFALMHWPNGLAMAACGVGAAVWTVVYLERRNVYALALSMGLAAAAFANALPQRITHNLRTGPIYVQRLADAEKAPPAGDSGPAE